MVCSARDRIHISVFGNSAIFKIFILSKSIFDKISLAFLEIFSFLYSRVGISGTTAKSSQRKFVPSSHTGPVALVASSRKSQTKVGALACFDFL